MNLVDSIAFEIEQQISNGTLKAGDKLHSVREEAGLRGISPTSMVEVYEILKSRGLVESRQRSGFFILATPPGLQSAPRKLQFLPSTSLAPEELLQDMLAAGNDDSIFPFGAAIPRPQFFPLNTVKRLTTTVLKDNPALLGAYRFPPGSSELRHTLAQRYQRFGVALTHEDIITTCGAIESVGLALSAVTSAGDTVAIETPTYPGIFHLVRSLGLRVLEIPLDAQRGLTPEALAEAISKSRGKLKALVSVPNFSNPLGTLMSDADKEAVVRLAIQADFWIIEDDVYADLSFSRRRPKTLKYFDTFDKVILCSSFAKSLSPSLRSGCVINNTLASKLGALKYARGTGISAVNEAILARFLKEGHYDKHLGKVCSQYRTLVAQYAQLVQQEFPDGTRISQPRGGYILWIELPHDVDGNLLQKAALKARISIAPGSIFSSEGTAYRNFIRLNCAVPWSTASCKAMKTLAGLIRRQ